MKKSTKRSILLTILLISVLLVSQFYFIRIDGTTQGKNTLSKNSTQIIDNIKHPLHVTVYLDGKLTGDYKILQDEINLLLNEFQEKNKNITYEFSDPSKKSNDEEFLQGLGIQAYNIPIEGGFLSIYPFAKVDYQGKMGIVSLLTRKAMPIENRAIPSIGNLEYAFLDEFSRISKSKRKAVGIVTHHSELLPIYRASLEAGIVQNYDVGIIASPQLDSLNSFHITDIEKLKRFDALLILKPVEPFSDIDKIVLDQYMMNGGKIIMNLESIDAEMDSLYKTDRIVAFPRDLNLTDWLFNYGVRFQQAIIKDKQASPIVLAVGNVGENTAYNDFPWPFFPLVFGENHPITKDLNPVKLEFANPIEILHNNDKVKSTVLLKSSPYTALQAPFNYIDFSYIQKQEDSLYKQGSLPIAVLLEGNFESAYAHRIESKKIPNFKSSSPDTKLIVVGDGDIGKNHVIQGQPLPLGADKYSLRADASKAPMVLYSNREFLLNSLDYLLDDNQLLALRSKNNEVYVLDKSTIQEDKVKWQFINIVFPMLFIGLFSLFGFYMRRKWM